MHSNFGLRVWHKLSKKYKTRIFLVPKIVVTVAVVVITTSYYFIWACEIVDKAGIEAATSTTTTTTATTLE